MLSGNIFLKSTKGYNQRACSGVIGWRFLVRRRVCLLFSVPDGGRGMLCRYVAMATGKCPEDSETETRLKWKFTAFRQCHTFKLFFMCAERWGVAHVRPIPLTDSANWRNNEELVDRVPLANVSCKPRTAPPTCLHAEEGLVQNTLQEHPLATWLFFSLLLQHV